jgi:hypothetical protein
VGFESGSVSFRIFYVPRPLPRDAIERFAAHAAPPIDTLEDGTIHGWVTGRHLLDRNITGDTAMYGGFLRLTLMQAERKIPESLLRAECRMEELARMQAEGTDRISGSVRREIRRSIEARLQPQMPPQLKGIHFVYDARNELIYTSALSDKQVDALQIHFAQTLGFSLIPATPDMAAMKRQQANIRDWEPSSFSPEREDGEVSHDPGLDFLTWLWCVAEARGGMMKVPGSKSQVPGEQMDIAVMIEGPLMLVIEGAAAHEAVLRKGEPLLSAEAKTSLLGGKKLRRAKVTLAHGENAYTFTFDAIPFVFRGLKLPEGGTDGTGEKIKLDAISRFQERMDQLDVFQKAFFGCYDRFVSERRDAKKWAATLKELHKWVSERKTRG